MLQTRSFAIRQVHPCDEQHVGRVLIAPCYGRRSENQDQARGHTIMMRQKREDALVLTFRVTSPRRTMAEFAPMDTLPALTRRLRSPKVCNQSRRMLYIHQTYYRGNHQDVVYDIDVTC